jgi:hypothetical protein
MKRICLLSLTITILAFAGGCSLGPKVEFLKGDNKIDVMIGQKYFTSYLYGGRPYKLLEGADKRDQGFLAKPVLFPVYSPSGIMVNRGYPLMEVEGETHDHPHHVGVFFSYGSNGEINGEDFWGNTYAPPEIKHIKVTEMTGGIGKGTLSTCSHWIGKTGKVLLEENRTMVFYGGKDEYTVDFTIYLTAQDEKVVFGDTKEGMFAIRVAPWLREDKGTGRYLSSEGDESPVGENIWGKRARWVRLQGEKDGKVVGVAIMNHPDSVNYPTYWHARDYGLFAANPLGQLAFQKGRKLENPQPYNFTLQPGQSGLFKFRLIIYEGPRTKEQLEQQFKDFTK